MRSIRESEDFFFQCAGIIWTAYKGNLVWTWLPSLSDMSMLCQQLNRRNPKKQMPDELFAALFFNSELATFAKETTSTFAVNPSLRKVLMTNPSIYLRTLKESKSYHKLWWNRSHHGPDQDVSRLSCTCTGEKSVGIQHIYFDSIGDNKTRYHQRLLEKLYYLSSLAEFLLIIPPHSVFLVTAFHLQQTESHKWGQILHSCKLD